MDAAVLELLRLLAQLWRAVMAVRWGISFYLGRERAVSGATRPSFAREPLHRANVCACSHVRQAQQRANADIAAAWRMA
jgi:hypothetical protein